MKEEQTNNRVNLVKNNKLQMPVYDFIKSINPDSQVNPTHNVELLKEHRLKIYQVEEMGFIEERGINQVETDNWEKNMFYYGWLKNEIRVIEQWMSRIFPNGEKKRGKISSAEQIEILKYEQYVKMEMTRIEKVLNDNPDESTSAGIKSPSCLLDLKSDQCQDLYEKLTKDGHFLSKNTNQAHFNYVFGGGVCPNDFAPLHWNRSKQAIGELILLVLKKPSIPRNIKRNAKYLFLINNKPIEELSNPKKSEPTKDYGILEDMLKNINTRPA